MEITKEQIEDSVRFANFAQRVKMAYWDTMTDGKPVPEIYLDDILLLAWEDFKRYGLPMQ